MEYKPAPIILEWEPVFSDLKQLLGIEYRHGRYRFLHIAKWLGGALIGLSVPAYFDQSFSLAQVALLFLTGSFFAIVSTVTFLILKRLAKLSLPWGIHSIRIDEKGYSISTGEMDTRVKWTALNKVIVYRDAIAFQGSGSFSRPFYLPMRCVLGGSKVEVLDWCRHNGISIENQD